MLNALAQADVQSVPSWWTSPAFAAILCAILLGTALLVVLIAMLHNRQRDPVAANEASQSLAEERAVERDIRGLMRELSEMARQVNQQLDARAERLEQLLHAADQRIEQLNALSDGVQHEPPPRPRVSVAVVQREVDPSHADIYALADHGCGLLEIARKLDRPRGEVELILALRPNQSA